MEAISSALVFSRPFEPGAANLVFGEDLLVTAAIAATLKGSVSVAAVVRLPIRASIYVLLKSDVTVSALVLQAIHARIAVLLDSDVTVNALGNVPLTLIVNQAIEAFTQDANALVPFFLQRNARTRDVYGQDREILISGQDRQMSVQAQGRHITLE